MPQQKGFNKILGSLLKTRATQQETELLREAGFTLKRPTKQTVIMAALYKKAASGDLSAIRELRSVMGEECAGQPRDTAVIIIDNIKDKNG